MLWKSDLRFAFLEVHSTWLIFSKSDVLVFVAIMTVSTELHHSHSKKNSSCLLQ
jgi:hypothetical protein